MSLVISEPGDGAVEVGVHVHGTVEVAYRMVAYLLAAARHPPGWKTDLPPLGAVELRRLCQGRLVRIPLA